MLKDEDSFSTLGIQNKGKLYFKDLGPQISWTTVSFVCSTSNHVTNCLCKKQVLYQILVTGCVSSVPFNQIAINFVS